MNVHNETMIRYPIGELSPVNLGLITYRNPNILMWWAAAFPGFPHLAMCKYITGGLLIIWEFFLNYNANINLAIMYSFTGRFEMAQQVLEVRWLLLYIPVYLFCIWDSRRIAMDSNKFAILANKSESAGALGPANVTWYENNLADKKKPGLALFWSMILPGLGHLYIHRLTTAFFIIIWIVVATYFSQLLPAIHLTFMGHFNQATEVLDARWLLFFPSMYGFAIYDSYTFCKKDNELFAAQQAIYFQKNFQPQSYEVSYLPKEVDRVNVIASFSSSIYIELVLKELELKGIDREHIFVIPLTEKHKEYRNIDIIRGKGINLFEVTIAFATAFMVLGTIYGFIWQGGPIIWGLIGLFTGAAIGFIIDVLLHKGRIIFKLRSGTGGEVLLSISCKKDDVEHIKNILFDHFTLGLSVLE